MLVFEVYLALLAVAALAVAWVPETVPQRQRLSVRFAGFGFPPSGRDEFFAAGVAGFAAFSLLGIFSALAPTFLGGVLHQHSHAVAGAVVFMIFAISAATQVVAGHFDYRKVVSFGLALFLLVLALIVAGLSQASLGLFLAGTGVGGVAVGCVFMGSLSTANRLAPAERRGQVVSSYFVFCYLGLAVPVIAVGISSEHFGIFRSVLVCSIALAVLSVFSLATFRRGGVAGQAREADSRPSWPHCPEYQGWLGPPEGGAGSPTRIRTFGSYIIFTTMSRAPPAGADTTKQQNDLSCGVGPGLSVLGVGASNRRSARPPNRHPRLRREAKHRPAAGELGQGVPLDDRLSTWPNPILRRTSSSTFRALVKPSSGSSTGFRNTTSAGRWSRPEPTCSDSLSTLPVGNSSTSATPSDARPASHCHGSKRAPNPTADMWATADETSEEIIELYHRAWVHSDTTIDALPLEAVWTRTALARPRERGDVEPRLDARD